MGIKPLQIEVTEGVSNNTTVPTLGKVEDLIGVENTWDRDTVGSPFLKPANAGDPVGATGTRISKIWLTDAESTNMPTVGGTSINANAVLDLTSAEVSQLANIGAETIDLTQWAILGAANQGIATTDTPTFAQVTVDNLILNANQLSASTGNLDLKAVSATGSIRILDDSDVPVFCYCNDTDVFTFSDTVTINVGNKLEVNTIDTLNAVTGVTVEGVELLNGAIKANSLTGLSDAILGITAYAGKGITLTGGDNADILLTAGLNGYVKMDNVRIYSSTVETTAGDLALKPVAGASVIIDSHFGFDGTVLTALTDANTTITAYAGKNITIETVEFDGGNVSTLGYINHGGIIAEIYVADASTSQSIPTGATYTKSTAFTTNGLNSNCTADAANDKITFTQTGLYRVSGSCSALSGTANVLWRGAAFLDGSEQDQVHWKRKMTTNTDSGDMSFTGFIGVYSVPIDLDLRLRHDNGGSVNFTIEYANLNVEYIGHADD